MEVVQGREKQVKRVRGVLHTPPFLLLPSLAFVPLPNNPLTFLFLLLLFTKSC